MKLALLVTLYLATFIGMDCSDNGNENLDSDWTSCLNIVMFTDDDNSASQLFSSCVANALNISFGDDNGNIGGECDEEAQEYFINCTSNFVNVVRTAPLAQINVFNAIRYLVFTCLNNTKNIQNGDYEVLIDSNTEQAEPINQDIIEPTNSSYSILRSVTPHGYGVLAFKCHFLGQAWKPAVLNNQAEADYIKYAQLGFGNIKNYWVGGTTNTEPWSLLEFSDYSTGEPGPNHVVVSTWTPTGYNLNTFQLMTLDPSLPIHNILCEKNED